MGITWSQNRQENLKRGGSSTDEINDLAGHRRRVSARHHLLDDGGGTGTILGAQERTGHRFVGARLSLLNTDAVIDGLGLGDVTLGGPAVDQSVGNVGGHLDLASEHVLDDFFGVGNAVVGDH